MQCNAVQCKIIEQCGEKRKYKQKKTEYNIRGKNNVVEQLTSKKTNERAFSAIRAKRERGRRGGDNPLIRLSFLNKNPRTKSYSERQKKKKM